MTTMNYTLNGFAVFFFITWVCLWTIHVIAFFYSRWKLHKTASFLPETPLPGVSILKPLLGEDANLSSNLETFFTMKYPLYELLFCVEDEKDPAVVAVSALMNKYPGVDAQLLTGGARVGVNPKINNMTPGLAVAKHELLLISDAGIRMRDDTLLDMVAHMGEKVGLVHQMPFTCDRPGFAATFEKVYFGTVQARMYLAADFLGVNCHVGMSSLIDREALREIGGMSAFGDYLAEDFFLAKALKEHGWKLRVSSQPAWQNAGQCSMSSFGARLSRWAQLRVAMLPLTIILEPLSECLVLGAAAAWACQLLLGWEPLAVFLLHALAWFLSDWALLSAAQQGQLPFNKFHFCVAWLLREVGGPSLFLRALLRRHVRWRQRAYKLSWGGLAHELKPNAKY